ncbi:MAG: tRNA dihydrouridine synthase DusB [Polyangia bacterium]
MKLGGFHIAGGAALAPMAGITNPPFRKLCAQLGAVLTCSELISCHALLHTLDPRRRRRGRTAAETEALLESFDGERPFCVQLFGRDPEAMAAAARLIEERGADVIDLNFGCPARKVVKAGRGSGAALMRDPARLERVTRSVVRAVGVPVTAKIRTGWSERERNAVEIARRIEDSGAVALCVHARTRDQVHSGPIDLESLADVCRAVRIPVIGNGGIHSLEDAERMSELTGCALVSVGQAARGNPWIFRELAGGSGAATLEERVSICRRHLQMYVEWCTERRAVLEMRKHACWYLRGFDGAAAFRARLSSATSVEAFDRLLDEVLSR